MPKCYNKCGESSAVTVSHVRKRWAFFQLWWNDYLENSEVLDSESFVCTSQCFFFASSSRTSTGAGWSSPRSCAASCLCADSWPQPHATCPIASWFAHMDCPGRGASSRCTKLALIFTDRGLLVPSTQRAFCTAGTRHALHRPEEAATLKAAPLPGAGPAVEERTRAPQQRARGGWGW